MARSYALSHTSESKKLRKLPGISDFRLVQSHTPSNSEPRSSELHVYLPTTNILSSSTSQPSQLYKRVDYLKQARLQLVNKLLIQSLTMQVNNSNPTEGLRLAELARRVAERASMYQSVAKAHFYRGLCLMDLQKYGPACAAFARAASIRDVGGKAARMGRIAAQMKRKNEVRR